MSIAYIYPEQLPSRKARSVSVVNTACELSRHQPISLFVQHGSESQETILKHYGQSTETLAITPVRKLFSNKIFNFNLGRAIASSDIELFYVRHLKTARYLITHKRPGQKVVFECHEIFHQTCNDFDKRKRLRRLEEFVYSNCDGIVFIHKALQQDVGQLFTDLTSQQTIAWSGARAADTPPAKEFDAISDIYYTGNFYKWKGIETLLTAMQFVENAHLHIIGGDSQERTQQIEALLHSFRVADKVTLHGFKPPAEVDRLLKTKAQLVVVPNLPGADTQYSLPLKLFEYMAAHTAIIASDTLPIREVTDNGGAVLLFEAGNAEALAETIMSVLPQPDLCRQHADYALRLSHNYTWQKRAERLLTFFKSL